MNKKGVMKVELVYDVKNKTISAYSLSYDFNLFMISMGVSSLIIVLVITNPCI